MQKRDRPGNKGKPLPLENSSGGDRHRGSGHSPFGLPLPPCHRDAVYLDCRLGLYAVQGAGGESTVDPYLVAAKLAPDSVLAYHTALELHGNAYSVHHQSLICTRHRVRPLSVNDHRYMALPPPKALRDRRQEDIGVETVDRSGLDVRVTRLERTLVDVLDRPDLGGGWEERRLPSRRVRQPLSGRLCPSPSPRTCHAAATTSDSSLCLAFVHVRQVRPSEVSA